MKRIYWLRVTTFLSAFLLFQIELITSKILLPKFGGTYLVWGACMVFFQCVLLAGYWFSHFVVQRFGISRYRLWHLIVITLPILFFPGKPLKFNGLPEGLPPVISIFFQLASAIGIAFFALSTTSLIFQCLLASSQLPEKTSPYGLYAVSNLGSFCALLSYPFFFETFFNLKDQLEIWRFFYFVFVILHCVSFLLIRISHNPEEAKLDIERIDFRKRIYWFILSAATCIMFLSVTNIISYEITPAPLLWIIPLCIYLLSFVLVFRKKTWLPEWIPRNFHVCVGLSIVFFFITQKRFFPLVLEIAAHGTLLFIICIFCQRELYLARPKSDKNLTTFYLIISLGAFFGGLIVNWLIPLISVSMIEYLLGLLFIASGLLLKEKKISLDHHALRIAVYFILLLMLWPIVFKIYNIFGLLIILMVSNMAFRELKKNALAFTLCLACILGINPFIDSLWTKRNYVYMYRNYYGIYKVYDSQGVRALMNGTILHGAQHLSPEKEMQPLTYYHPITPIGQLLQTNKFKFTNTAAVGLGAGVLATFIKEGQRIDFFELDPDVYPIASSYFTFLKKTRGKTSVTFGDARISMAMVPEKSYDIIIVDAFSGDSIPPHLITLEAIMKYRRCLKDQGIIVFHVSNRYLNMVPLVFRNGYVLGAQVCNKQYLKKQGMEIFPSQWVALTWDSKSFGKLIQLEWKITHLKGELKKYRPWTDEYSNILPLLKLEFLVSEIKHFEPLYWEFDVNDF